jgi:spermidine/putrescine transport system permease protein
VEAATAPAPPARRRKSLPARAWAWLRYHAVSIWAALAIAYLLVPIALIAVFSFNDPEGKFNYTWNGFTFDHWSNIFGIPDLTDALITSLKLAALSTLVSTILGTMIALALVRHHFVGRRAANFLIVIPMATPEVVIGASLLSMFLIYGASLGFGTLLIAHVMFSISFVVIVVRSRLIGFDRRLEEAARDLGASPLTTFRTITLPLLMPGLVGAALLAFALSIDDFVISNFNSGTTVTFPLWVFGAAQRGIPVEVYSIATMLFAVTVLAMVFVTWQQRRAEQLAAVRQDDEADTGFAALASGQEPASRAGATS